MNNYLNRAIDWLCLFLFLILISFPIFQILGRYFSFFSIPASQEIVQHMTLWIGFIGAVIAARSNMNLFGFGIVILCSCLNVLPKQLNIGYLQLQQVQ